MIKWLKRLDTTTHIVLHSVVLTLWWVGALRSSWKLGHGEIDEAWFVTFALFAIWSEIKAIRRLQRLNIEFALFCVNKGKQELAEHISGCVGCRQAIAELRPPSVDTTHSLN